MLRIRNRRLQDVCLPGAGDDLLIGADSVRLTTIFKLDRLSGELGIILRSREDPVHVGRDEHSEVRAIFVWQVECLGDDGLLSSIRCTQRLKLKTYRSRIRASVSLGV